MPFVSCALNNENLAGMDDMLLWIEANKGIAYDSTGSMMGWSDMSEHEHYLSVGSTTATKPAVNYDSSIGHSVVKLSSCYLTANSMISAKNGECAIFLAARINNSTITGGVISSGALSIIPSSTTDPISGTTINDAFFINLYTSPYEVATSQRRDPAAFQVFVFRFFYTPPITDSTGAVTAPESTRVVIQSETMNPQSFDFPGMHLNDLGPVPDQSNPSMIPMRIGADTGGNSGDIEIAEMIIYEGHVSDSKTGKVMQYFKDKYHIY